MCVLGGVLLSRTLAGAVPSALSGLASGFGMGAGRFPVAVTTETSGMGSACVDSVVWLLWPLAYASRGCGVLFVWGGLGVDRIVDASRLLLSSPHPYAPSLWRAGGWGVLFVLAY